jgi:hypothetical protein
MAAKFDKKAADECVAKLADKKAALEGVQGFAALFAEASASAKVSLYSYVPQLMEACGDKQKPVANAAATLVKGIYTECSPWSGGYMMPLLKDSLLSKAKPAVKMVACDVVADFARSYPESMSLEIEWCLALLSALMNDVKKEVKEKATAAAINVSQCSGNKDLEKFTDTIVKAQVKPETVPECVEELAGCIFVQNVEAPALALIAPVLVRGLNDRSEATKRRCCVIVDNMCKLIDDPREGSPLMAQIRGLVEKSAESISDPDARAMAEKAHCSINKLVDAGPYVEQDFKAFAAKASIGVDSLEEEQATYCSKAAFQLVKAKKPAQAGVAFEIFGFDGAACEAMVESMSIAGEAV